jgi:hypothetical protein
MPIPRDSWDLVLVEKGRFVSIRKDGREIGFSSLDQLRAYTGVDLAGKTYLAYEPRIGRLIDEAAGAAIDFSADMLAGIDRTAEFLAAIEPFRALVFSLESLFARFDRIRADLADPYWGLTSRLKAWALKLAEIEATDAGMARVAEDSADRVEALIDLLAAEGVIKPAQADALRLPPAAREKLRTRQAIRAGLAKHT